MLSQIQTYAYAYACTHKCTHKFIQKHAHLHTPAHTQAHTHKYKHIGANTYTHTPIQVTLSLHPVLPRKIELIKLALTD